MMKTIVALLSLTGCSRSADSVAHAPATSNPSPTIPQMPAPQPGTAISLVGPISLETFCQGRARKDGFERSCSASIQMFAGAPDAAVGYMVLADDVQSHALVVKTASGYFVQDRDFFWRADVNTPHIQKHMTWNAPSTSGSTWILTGQFKNDFHGHAPATGGSSGGSGRVENITVTCQTDTAVPSCFVQSVEDKIWNTKAGS